MNQEWDATEALRKWLANNTEVSQKFREQLHEPIHIYELHDTIPIAEIERTVVKSARLVQQLGLAYIDIFERAERELKMAREKLETMERIRHIADQSPIHSEGLTNSRGCRELP